MTVCISCGQLLNLSTHICQIHNATGGNDDAPSTRPSPRRWSYRVGSPTPIDDFLETVSKHVGDMIRMLNGYGYHWDAETETWTGPGIAAEHPS